MELSHLSLFSHRDESAMLSGLLHPAESMPYFTEAHLSDALEVLPARTHQSLISFLAMLRNKVPVTATASKAFGSAQETELLQDYFRPPGGTPDRPW